VHYLRISITEDEHRCSKRRQVDQRVDQGWSESKQEAARLAYAPPHRIDWRKANKSAQSSLDKA
jgi:hypothetical protein